MRLVFVCSHSLFSSDVSKGHFGDCEDANGGRAVADAGHAKDEYFFPDTVDVVFDHHLETVIEMLEAHDQGQRRDNRREAGA